MRFELLEPWPVGQFLVPAGTIIDGKAPQWRGMALPLPMPMDAKALDQDAADHLSMAYPFHLHLLHAQSPAKIRQLINVSG
jgi:hypothetical protein